MQIKFNYAISENSCTDLNFTLLQDFIGIEIEYTNFPNREKDIQVTHFADKKQLEQIIGALLHLQSKFRK